MSRKVTAPIGLALAAALWAILAGRSTPRAADGTAARPYPPSEWVLGPIYGTACPQSAACGTGRDMASEVNADLDRLSANDIPITAYHFDGSAWSSGSCTWALGKQVLDRLRASEVRGILHFWGGCDTTQRLRSIYSQIGTAFGALYLDERATDGFANSAFGLMQTLQPNDGEVVMKAYQDDRLETDAGLAAYGHAAYVGDLRADFEGLRAGIQRVFSKRTLLPAPYNEFTGYDLSSTPTEEAYFRRLHWGAMQMVMEQDCAVDCDPWGSRFASYSPALLSAFRYYSWLHAELVPYLHSYDYQAYETGQPVFRDSDAAKYTTRLGEELFVAYVTQPGVAALDITLPPGDWVNYWNDAEVFTGGTTISYPVPLGREPIFIRRGAIIPMQVSRDYTGHGTAASEGSLTVLVYPTGTSTFSYRDQGYWVTFTARLDEGVMALHASPAPSQPVIYRVSHWPSPPVSVGSDGMIVTVNEGGGVPVAASEDEVNGATEDAWFYDAAAARLIVKVFPPGTHAHKARPMRGRHPAKR